MSFEILDIIRDEFTVTSDETRILFLKIIEQAIRDYTNLSKSHTPIEVQYYDTAKAFLLEEGYTIQWGENEINMKDILDYLNLDHDWFHRKINGLLK